MRRFVRSVAAGLLAALGLSGCGGGDAVRVVFLHHSTGRVVWDAGVKRFFRGYRTPDGRAVRIEEREFPREKPYGWNNYPYDYWNIWVAHAGGEPYMEEPTLEILATRYDVVVLKHCFPVSAVEPDTDRADAASPEKRLENYRLQYEALRDKMRSFPGTRFLVWTPPALVAGLTDAGEAARADSFARWVREEWDEPGDNIFVWDFRLLETEGGLYLKEENARGPANSHPAEAFAARVAPLLGRRIAAVIEGRGDKSSTTGE